VAITLQMHIFLVLQLHQHQATLDSIAQSQSSHASPSLHAVNLLCPACQIAKHGIVHPPSETLVSATLPQIERAQALLPSSPSLVPFLKLSGRDPPRR
jgi:hypothetical protein